MPDKQHEPTRPATALHRKLPAIADVARNKMYQIVSLTAFLNTNRVVTPGFRCKKSPVTHASKIFIETSIRLGLTQELAVHRAAFEVHPNSVVLRARMAALLLQLDLFDEVIGLLENRADLTWAEMSILVQAYLSLETAEGDQRAHDMAKSALPLATTDGQRADILADMAKAMIRLGDENARGVLEQSLSIEPANKNACKRLATWLMNRGNPEAVLAFTAECMEKGAAHSRLFAARSLAFARLGQTQKAKALDGRDQFGMHCDLPAPPGWDSIEEFNRALADQLLSHPALRYERYGTASEKTWRVDSPNTTDAPLVAVLLEQIRDKVVGHLDTVKGVDHPWAKAAPENTILHCWCVITEGTGFETWHVHQFGWLSGVYYVAMPDDIEQTNENGGCLAHGLPPEIVGEDGARDFGVDIIRPTSGHMRVFPSHCYHRTFPHHAKGKRICIAFDFWPD